MGEAVGLAAGFDELLVYLAEIETLLLGLEEPDANLDQASEDIEERFAAIAGLAEKAGAPEVRMPLYWLKSLMRLAAKGIIPITEEVMDVLLEPVDFMRRLLVLAAKGETAQPTGEAAGKAAPEAPPPSRQEEPDRRHEARHPKKEQAGQTQPQPAANAGRGGSIIKVDTSKLDTLVNVLGELVITHTLISQDGGGNAGVELTQTLTHMSELIDHLHSLVMDVRMVPLKTTFSRLERLVREVAQLTGKKARLTLVGGDTELDKSVAEALYDPMVHLLRNAVDHGLEPPEDRALAGKDPTGSIELIASKEGGRVIINLSDDGRGLDRASIAQKGLSLGLLSPNRNYSDREIFDLITLPDFSTAQKVSQVSGRGVGMDVVKTSLKELGARLEISSTPGEGAVFSINLPASKSTSDSISEAMVVRVAGEVYVIPTKHLVEVAFPKDSHFASVMDQGETVFLRDQYIPLVRLGRLLGCPANNDDERPQGKVVVVVEAHGRSKGLLVDELVGLQTVVTRPLDRSVFGEVRMISALGLMGGTDGLVVEVEALFGLEADRRQPALAEAVG